MSKMGKTGKMKRALIGIIILASLCFLLWMATPALVGLPFPLGGFMCKGGENACVKIDVAEAILPDKPTSVTITVISLNDIPELHVTLSYWPSLDVTIEEEPDQPSPMQGGVAWISSVQPFHRITYTRKIHLPSIEGEYIPGQSGGYQLIDFKASIWIPGHNPINNGLIIFVTSQWEGISFRRAYPHYTWTTANTSARSDSYYLSNTHPYPDSYIISFSN